MLNKIKNFFAGFFSLLWVSMMASFLAGPGDIGGAEINGFLAFLLWILFVYLIIKRYAIVASTGSTVLLIVLRIYKFGIGDMSGDSEIISQVIVGIAMFFIFYNLIFGSKKGSGGRTEYRSRQIQGKEIDHGFDSNDDSIDPGYNSDYDSYSSCTPERDTGPKLVSGSDGYWEYKEAAEMIYRDFCDANSITERRYHKQRGERLKERLLSEYGAKDACVRSIIDQFLDLRA